MGLLSSCSAPVDVVRTNPPRPLVPDPCAQVAFSGDADADGLTDTCELALARAWAPTLLADPADCSWTGEPRARRLAGGQQAVDRRPAVDVDPQESLGRAFGVVANVHGTVTGTGRIDWTEDGITSSGRFSSQSLDFAAAFGPVKGASGTVEFSDLLGLTTPPGQTLTMTSINPGILVENGVIRYQLLPNQLVRVERGEWPFMGGRLILHETILNFARPTAKRLTFEVVGLDAAAAARSSLALVTRHAAAEDAINADDHFIARAYFQRPEDQVQGVQAVSHPNHHFTTTCGKRRWRSAIHSRCTIWPIPRRTFLV